VAACADAPRTPDFTIDTVAGIVTVKNQTSDDDTAPAEPVRLASIGSVGLEEGGPDEFGRVNSIVSDANGHIYVADGPNFEIRVFDASGRHLRTFGRQGGGPGEFGALYSLAWIGDTLLALDPNNARISLLTPEGDPIGTWRWMPLTGSVTIIRFFQTGAKEAYTRVVRRDTLRPRDQHLVRLIPAGPADTIAIAQPTGLQQYGVICPDAGAIHFFAVPFAPGFLATPAPGGRVAVARTADYRIAFLDASGDTVRVVERVQDPVAVSDAEWDALMAEFRTFRERSPNARCDPAEPLRPPAMPAIRGVEFDLDGRMIVEANTAAGPVFDIYDREGIHQARIRAPIRDERVPPYFRDGIAYLVMRDSLDVQSVVSYRLDPGRASRSRGEGAS